MRGGYPMGFFDRLRAIVGAKLEKGLDAVEDPNTSIGSPANTASRVCSTEWVNTAIISV